MGGSAAASSSSVPLFVGIFLFFRALPTCGGVQINYQLSQPQIYIEDGNIYIVPAQGRNLVLASNGDGKILFDEIEMRSLVSSVRNSTRDLDSFKQIFGSPSNSSAGLSQRIASLEQTMYRLNLVETLDTRLTNVERQILFNSTQTQQTEDGSRRNSVNNRLRRLTSRVEVLENRLARGGGGGGGRNPCSSNPCSHGGSCIPTAFGPFCWCRDGWEGPTCEQDTNECANFAGTDLGCQNQATCLNKPGGYDCQCRPGWMGIHCTKRQGDCSSGPAWELCGHGICINQASGARPFICMCDQGWKTDGSSPACNVDVNECDTGHALCSTNPPVNCINTPGSYMCGPCPAGFTGNGHRCMDVNECLVGNGGCSMNPMVQCINTPGSRTCGECPPGYMGNGIVCQYVGLCAVNNGGCHPMARCAENPVIGQSFVQCLCPAGYTGTGMGLHGCFPHGGTGGGGGSAVGPPNPCGPPSPCANSGICQPHGNAFTCICFNGFSGPTCSTRQNPCLVQPSPCQNNGVCSPNPLTTSGFTCTCGSDFTGEFCQDQVQSCGGVLATDQGRLSFPHDTNPDLYMDNMNCVWTMRTEIGKVFNLTFSRFHLEGYPDGACPHDSLTILDGADQSAPLLGRYCGDVLPNGGSVISTHESLYIKFSSDHSIVGLGFEFTWNTTSPVCGGYITNKTHGSINSPGYPGNYPHNRDCEWQIAVNPGKRIQLVFATFRIESHPNCTFDYFQVRDGLEENAPSLAYYCNTILPPPIVSSGAFLSIRFHSDGSSTDAGFHITFAEVPGIPGCGGVLTQPNGVFSSPEHPEPYAHGLECDWLIRLPSPGDRITLHFNTFQLEGSSNCRYDYVEVHDGPTPNSAMVGRFCGSSIPPDFQSSGSTLFVKFKSDESVAYGGFSAKYEAVCGGVFSEAEGLIRSPYYPNPYPKNRDCVYLISAPPGKGILLDFMDFDIESVSDVRCYFDYLEIRDGDTENSTLLGHFCGPPTSAPDRIVSTHNYIWLKFKTDSSVQNRGFLANYSTYDTGCGGIIRDSHGVISSPGHPEIYPHGVSCTWVLRGLPGQAVRLTWISFSLEAATGCRYDFVQVFDNSSLLTNGSSIGRFCGHDTPPVLTSSDNTMTVVFQSDHSVAHDGFMANFVLLNTSTVCGGEFFSEYGIIRSPRYPQFYPNRKSCTWTIKVPTGRQIRLNISDFDLEAGGSSRQCNYDFLEIRNGAYTTSPLIGRFCGNVQPPPMIPSFSNSLHLKFVSDMSHAGRGFMITWDGTTTGCGGALTSPTGSIVSPNYPQNYGSRTECIWTISINQGSALQLVFVDLDIQHSSSCWGEYIEIRDGRDHRAPLLGKYCHSDSVLSLNTTGNLVWIKFLSGYGGTGRGFQMNYRATCNRVITGFHGVIESPNFPNPYPHNRNCTWELQAPLGNKLNVSFSHFDIEGPPRGGERCVYDFVNLKEWKRPTHTTDAVSVTDLGKFCGSTRPPLISSTKDTLSINFVSDYSYAMNGFRLEWKVNGCGGRLIGSYNYLRSPNYPNKYGNNVVCLWHVTTELGTKVELQIYELEIERSEDCRYDGLTVYGGSDATSPQLTSLCHSSGSIGSPVIVTSHGNNMYIKFYSDGSVPSKGFYGSVRAVAGGCGGRFRTLNGFVQSPNYPGNYDHNDDCGWLIEVDQNHVVELRFMDFSVERHINCSYDHVAIYDGVSTYDPLLLMHCGSSLPYPPLIRSSGNKMYLRLKTDGSASSRGFKANFTTGCGARITPSGWSRSLTSPHYPSPLLPNTNCSWILSTPEPDEHVTFTVTNLAIHSDPPQTPASPSSTGSCAINFVEILDGEDVEAPSLGKFCSTQIPPSFTSRGNSLLVRLQIGENGGGFGFRGVYDFASSACGSTTLLTSMNGSFTSPNYPNGYPPNIECIWNIQVSAGNKIQLSFRRFEVESSDHCNTDFVEIHESDSEGRLLGHFCGNDIPANLTAATSLWVMFRTDGEGQAVGFWADYNLEHGNELSGAYGVIESPGYPQVNTITGTYSWRVSVNESYAIQVAFTDVDLVNYVDQPGDCDAGFVRIIIYDGYDEQAPILLKSCSGTSLSPVTSTGNIVYVQYVRPYWSGKFRLVWNQVQPASSELAHLSNITGCGGNYSIDGNVTTLLSPNYPFVYPHNIRCVWFINSPPHTRIQIQVEDFDMESNVNCLFDKVEIYDGQLGLPNYVLNKTLCHRTQINGTLLSSGRFLQIVMITDSSDARPGFNLSLSAVCGGYSREPRGKITSPGYPGMYFPSLCDWSIIVRPGRTISTRFEFLDIYGDSSGCVSDELIVRNGGSENSPFLGAGRYCGSTAPSLPETSGNQLHVSFRSWTSNRRGFSLVYEEVGAGCGGEIYLTDQVPSTIISSPNFPNIPPPFTECEWRISVPQGEAVQLRFLLQFDFDLSSPNCQRSGIELYDGGTAMSNLIGRHCRTMPGTQKSTGNIMYVRYYTDVPEPRQGFKAEVKIATCGGLLTGWIGRIQSPGYPTPYDVNLDCLWTIRSPSGTYVQLRFQEVDLGATPETGGGADESSNSSIVVRTDPICRQDQDRIFVTEPSMADVEYPRNWTICTTQRFLIQSSTNEISIRFISDDTRDTTRKGFRVAFFARNEPCGGVFRASSGVIQTPNYPNPYPHYRHCSWRIVAPEDRRVRLEFLDFDLEETYTSGGRRFCYDSVSIFQGRWRDLPRLYNRTLCGPNLPPPVETTQNEMTIYFGSDNSVAHRGFKARYSTDLPRSCGGLLPPGNGTLLSPNISTGTPDTTTNALCYWSTGSSSSYTRETNGTTIVTINSLRIPPWGGPNDPNCPQGSLLITPSDVTYKAAWKKLCGSVSGMKLYLPGSKIQVDYEAAWVNSTFSLEYRVASCGERLAGPLDNITSLNYPSTYPLSTECIWILEYSPASQIRIRFLDLDLDDHRGGGDEGCDRDYVIVRNGKYQTSPMLGKFCGSNSPPDIVSMSSHVWIEFHSDENSDPGRRGFSVQTEKVARGCGGIIHRKYGRLTSPEVPAVGPISGPGGGGNIHQTRSANGSSSKSVPGYVINLMFDGRFDIEQSTNCSNDYVELFAKKEGNSDGWDPLGRFCGRQIPPAINTTTASIKVRFVSNTAIDGNGFSLVWYSPCGGLFKEPSAPEIQNPEKNGAQNTIWTRTIRSAHFDRFNHSSSLNQENYWNFVGWESNWVTKRCDYVIQAGTEDYVVLEFLSPFDITVPSSYGVKRSEVLEECPEVNLTMWQGNSSSRPQTEPGVVCGTNLPPAFVGKGAVTISYNYRPQFQNEGFLARYSIFRCGGFITEPSLVSSPGHPFTSAPHMNCTWVIRAPANRVVRFRFETLELEFHSRCVYDFVKLFDGEGIRDDKLLGTFCGNMTKDFHPLSSKGNSMTLQFSTDWTIQHGGFSGVVEFTAGESQGCGGQKNVSSGPVTIQSVTSNGNYEPMLDCQWLIAGPDFHSLDVTFQFFNLEGGGRTPGKSVTDTGNPCPYDYIEMWDGPGPFSQKLGKFCGSQTPPAISSSNNYIWIRFVTDSSYNFPGFTARITSRESPCGRNFVLNATTTESQVLTSPQYPSQYPPNTRCKWIIDGASFFDEVDVKFIEMDIPPSSDCSNDWLEIKDVSTSYTSPEGISGPILFIGNGPVDWRHRHVQADDVIMQDVRYCGSQTPPDFFSVGRSIELVFRTDSSGSGRGFKLEYKAAGCNRTYENHQGRIFSPEFPSHSPVMSNCQFSIRAGNGTYISLYFNKFLLPGTPATSLECSEAAMEVRDGSPNGRGLGKFCGSSLPNPIFSLSNVLWIRYFTRIALSRGYDISYTTTTSGRGCGGAFFHTGGSFRWMTFVHFQIFKFLSSIFA
ncbi:Cubilin [Folsomia candida]|uniref:Cubilin n=1 Tax=Folsomia candida TaxID=158441 RepID=A0A226DQH9_FOLCA|nr:Cubilin [Folsomia candida]